MTIQELIDSLKNRKPAANAPATNNTPDVAALQKRISETRKQVAAIFTQAQRTPVAAKLVACVHRQWVFLRSVGGRASDKRRFMTRTVEGRYRRMFKVERSVAGAAGRLTDA